MEVPVIEDVTFDDTGVRRVSPEGGVEEARWDDLAEVRIVTTDEGPFGEDVYWLLAGSDGTGVAVPGFSVTDDLLRLQSLPGFDNEQMIQATMTSTDNAQFLCWQRDGAQAP